jgi:hypothetical protein
MNTSCVRHAFKTPWRPIGSFIREPIGSFIGGEGYGEAAKGPPLYHRYPLPVISVIDVVEDLAEWETISLPGNRMGNSPDKALQEAGARSSLVLMRTVSALSIYL